jgi:hypothetical protein
MTFIVDADGVVYQKDLGKKPDALAKAMKEYNPNSSWQKAEEEQEETTDDQKAKQRDSVAALAACRSPLAFNRLSITRPRRINLSPRAKMIVHADKFAGKRGAAI